MTEQELREKIVDTLNATEISVELEKRDIYKFADALIAAGIGDVKEAERRREVAERALLNYCKRTISFPESVAKNELEKAEKELAEERKDD